MKRAIDVALGLLVADLCLSVLSGGFSIYGPVDVAGFWARIAVSLGLLALRYRQCGSGTNPRWYGYLAILLLCLCFFIFVPIGFAETVCGITPTRAR